MASCRQSAVLSLGLSARAPLVGTRHLVPETERAGPQETMVSCPEQVAADPEQMLDAAVHRCEPLQMGRRLEPAHLPLALTSRLMRDLRSVVFVLPGTVEHGRHHRAVRRRVAAQLVGDQPARLAALSFAEPCRFNSLRKNRLAARRLRRDCTRRSSTSPSSSTARHRYCRRPRILTNSCPDARCRPDGPGGAATAVRSRARTFDTSAESPRRSR